MSRFQTTLCKFSLALLFCTSPGFANDTIGTTASGGIQFTQTSKIAMDREQLTISPQQIKVAYLFENKTKQDITTQVYFPLPPYKAGGLGGIWDNEIGTTHNAPFTNFTVRVQNQPVKVAMNARAVMNGNDITAELQKANIPLNPDLVAGAIPSTQDEMVKVKQWQQAAKQLNLLDKNDKPLWQKQIVYYWTQTFPANKIILVEHIYKPATGMFFSAPEPNQTASDIVNENTQRIKTVFSLNVADLVNGNKIAPFITTQVQSNQENTHNNYAYFYNVDYILTTGANWAGPIKNFTLNIMKPNSGVVAYNKFYGKQKATEKETPVAIHLYLQNFTPKQDLSVLYATGQNVMQ